MRKYTPDNIDKLKPNQIFVFGSNAKGIHGKGGALIARSKFGAIYGQASGLQGKSYAIITKKDWRIEKSSSLDEIFQEIWKFINFAFDNPQYEFLVTKIGCSLAGYSVDEIKSLWIKVDDLWNELNGDSGNINEHFHIPNNIILPKEFEFRE